MDCLQRLIEARALERIARHDASLFSDDPSAQADVAERLGWTTLAADAPELLPRLEELTAWRQDLGIEHVGLLGMGGSSLAALVMASIIGPAPGHPKLHVLDTTSPRTVMDVQDEVDMERAGWLVSSKSGSTIEPNSLYSVFREEADASLGRDEAGAHFVAITDPGSSLETLAEDDGFAATVLAPPAVGGRYSALSAFGLVPAALIGIDVELLAARGLAVERSASAGDPAEHPAVQLAAFLGDAVAAGRNKLMLVMPPDLRSFGLWVEQLVAESLGKRGLGIVPVVELSEDPPVRSYGDDAAIAVICLAECERFLEGIQARGEDRIPLHATLLDDPYDLGAAFVMWEWAVALTGFLLGVDPFDQPDVAAAKRATSLALEGELSIDPATSVDLDEARIIYPSGMPVEPPRTYHEALRPLVASLGDRDYLALLAYLPDSADVMRPLTELAGPLSAALGRPVCLELGPRYLHSTGQLHKGGPDEGVFVVLLGQDGADVPVPGQEWMLSDLNRAQALGDLATLSERGRRAIGVVLRDASADSVATFADALARAARL